MSTPLRYSLLPICVSLLLLGSSCSKKNSDTALTDEGSRLSEGYLPLRVGQSITYDVDSIQYDYNGFCGSISSHYQLMYTFADTFRDRDGLKSYRIEKRYRKNDNTPWTAFRDVDLLSPSTSGVNYKSATLQFRTLDFPVAEGRTWSGTNANNTIDSNFSYLAGWTFRYRNIDKPFEMDSVRYSNTLTVDQIDEKVGDIESASGKYASRKFSREVYARGIGMVYKSITYWTYDPSLKACKRGYSVTMHAVQHQ